MITAHLVVFVDTGAEPPVVVDCGVYTDPHPTSMGDLFPLSVCSVTHNEFDAAESVLFGMLEHPSLRWAKKLMLGKKK
jgi:hypothetical protein